MTPKSDQIIVPPISINEPSVKLIRHMVFKLSREQTILNSVTLNFNLMTSKSNQMTVPPIRIKEPSLNLIRYGSQVIARTSHFSVFY